MQGNFVGYYRVSRKTQGESGLGLDAQKRAVASYLNGGSWSLLAEFVEIESGKRDDNRPKLQEALTLCKRTGATLVIAKLDRLSRNSAFLNNLMESGADFVCCDMPSATPLTIRILAAVAQDERERIALRTKEGLASIKAKLASGQEHVSKRSGKPVTALGGFRGVMPSTEQGRAARTTKALAFAQDVGDYITKRRSEDASLRAIAADLNALKWKSPRGSSWTPMTVKRVLDRLASPAAP